MPRDQQLKSLKRGLRTLLLLSHRRTMTISEVARELELPRTTAERVLLTLLHEGFIVREPVSRRFALGPRVLGLAGGYSIEDRLVEVATPLLFAKTREIGWPLAIAVAVGEKLSVRATTDPATSLGLHKRYVGSEIAMAAASGGVVHLAFLDPVEREEQIALLAASGDPNQALARDRRTLDAYIAAARDDGFAIGPGRGAERALSVPLFHEGRIRAVLVMMYIARAVKPDQLTRRYAPEVKALAAAIEQALARAETAEPARPEPGGSPAATA